MKTERKIIFREVWRDEFNLDKLVKLIYQYKDTDIVVDCLKESQLYTQNHGRPLSELMEIAKVKNINNNLVHLVIGNYSTYCADYYNNDMNTGLGASFEVTINIPMHENAIRTGIIDQVHCWPSYFLCWNGMKILNGFVGTKPRPDPHKEKLFYLPIRQAKNHRMLLLDELEKRNLLAPEISAFTCLDPNNVWEESLYNVGGTHYKLGKKNLQNGKEMPDDIYRHPPNVMKKCLINVVSETSFASHFFTEKTVWPLLYQMPFIIHGAAGINKKLTTLGFKLFDEIIDYSFDNIQSPRERTMAIANELKRLADLNLNYTQIYANIKDKLEHNLCRLIDLYHNDEYMPGFVRNASDQLVEETLRCSKNGDYINPIIGSWHAYLDSNGRNQKAVDIVRDEPYFWEMYQNWL